MRKQRNVRMDWFQKVKREFSRVVLPFAGKPILYVEVGVWAGNSAEWMLQNVLTHKDAEAIGIDPYLAGHTYNQAHADATHDEMRRRLSAFISAGKLSILRDKSQNALRDLNNSVEPPGIDILYLDGCHDAHSIVLDFSYAWPMLKTGSIVIFDDYGIGKRKGQYHVPAAVEAIKLAFGRWIETISEGRQYAIKVREIPELGAIHHTV